MTEKQIAKKTGQRQYREYKRTTRVVEMPQRPKRERKQRYGGGGVVAEIMRHDKREEKELGKMVRAIKSKDDGFRSTAKVNRNGLRITDAPVHETFGYGERWFVKHTQFVIGRSGNIAWNRENAVFKFTTTNGAPPSEGYAQSINFGSIFAYNGPTTQLGWASSAYGDASTSSTLLSPIANVVTSGMKFMQAAAFRGARIRYIPSVSKMVPGTLAFAAKYVDSRSTSIDETSFSTIASLPRAICTPVCESCEYQVFPNAKLSQPALQLTMNPGISAGGEYWALLGAVDTVLPTETTDVLGHLEVDVVYDCYGKGWLADDVKGTSLTREEQRIADVLKKLRDYDMKELADAKEAKQKSLEVRALGEHKDLDDDDWQKIQQADSRQKICDLKAYRESLKMAQNTCSQSASTSSTTTTVAPNVQSRTPKL